MAINLLKINAEAVLCTGDLHGNLNSIGYQIKQFGIQNSVLICCGDIGLGFNKLEYYKQYLNKLKKVLTKYNDYVILLRGNHDDKVYFDNKLINDKRIKAVSDYTIVQVYPMDDIECLSLPYNVLCVGGATSIDRMHRISVNNKLLMEYSKHHNMETLEEAKKNCLKCYWEDEAPVYDEETLNEIKEQGITIDAVTTHTCPSFCQPITKDGIRYWMQFDTNLEKDIDNERNVMDKLYNKLIEDKHPLSVWCYGHYHYHHNDSINGIKYYLLDMERNGKMDIVTIYKNAGYGNNT